MKDQINMDMRRFLTKPVIKFGCYSSIGGKSSQEDRIVAIPDVNYSGIGYCAIFDGHGGAYVADYLARNFHLQLSLHSLFKYQTSVALQESWKLVDDKLYDACARFEQDHNLTQFPHDGSTATVCLVVGETVMVTNIGDSAAYVLNEDGISHKLTEDHGTGNLQEVERCRAAGGDVIEQVSSHQNVQTSSNGYSKATSSDAKLGLLCCLPWLSSDSNDDSHVGHTSMHPSGHSHHFVIKPRVYPGGLLVTRSFGDFYAKKDHLGGKKNIVIADHGEVKQLELRKDKVKYIVIASDGVWDIFDIHQVHAMIVKQGQLPGSAQPVEQKPALSSALRSHATVSPAPATNNQVLSPVPGNTNVVTPLSVSSSKIGELNTVREEIHEMALNGHINTKESALDGSLSLLCKKICLNSVHAPEWAQEGARADNASCIIIEISFPSS